MRKSRSCFVVTKSRPDDQGGVLCCKDTDPTLPEVCDGIDNNENRIKEEAQIVDFFKKEGLQVTNPDLDAFRKAVQASYQNSEYAKVWPKGLVDRINNTR